MSFIDSEINKLYRVREDFDNESFDLNSSHQNLENQVYEIIKNRIISHELKPGERIIDRELAEELGVSRSLVRQAFTILEKEELIVSVPRSGFYVREITKQDVKDIYEIRKVLETYITRCAVPRLSEEDIENVEKVFETAKQELEDGNVRKVFEVDAKLHQMLINNCGNEKLKKTIDQYNDYYLFYRVVDLSHLERAKEAYYNHYDLFQAIKAEKRERAVELMEKHIEHAKNIILDNFEEYTYG